MEAKSQFLRQALLLITMCLFPISASALTLNGVATYQELNNDYYVAALYGPQRSNDRGTWLNADQEKKMVILIKTNQWSKRSWFKKWQNNIAINNSIETYSKDIQNSLDEFSRLPKGDMVTGDLLNIHFVPKQGTKVYVNEQIAMQSPQHEFFIALLNTWLGKLPPSRLFKSQILDFNKNPSARELTSQLESLKVSEARRKAAFNWYSSPEELAKQEQEKKRIAEQQAQAKAEKLAREAAERSLAIKLKAIQEKREVEEKKKLALEQKRKEEAEQKRLAALKLKEQEQARKQKELVQAQAYKAKQRKSSQKYYQRFYEWQLQTAIRKEITYPEWARKFKEQGLIQAVFKINNKGIVQDVQISADAPSMLAAEVRDSIKSISGKLLPPKELEGASWQFTVQHQFQFGSNRQAQLVRPKKPKYLTEG